MPAIANIEVVPLTHVPQSESAAEGSDRRPVVLVVDDEPIIADTRVAIFAGWGCAAMAAYDSESALDMARVIPPELLICDVTLSGMNGIELAIEIQKEVPDCKVLLVSGQVVSGDLLARAHDVGHNFTMLTKPVHPSEMAARISELNFRWPDLSQVTQVHHQRGIA